MSSAGEREPVYRYQSYGLNIESDFELPGLQSGFDSALPSVSVCQARSPRWTELADRHDGGDFLFLRTGNMMRFWFDHGASLTFAVHRDFDPDAARFYMQSIGAGTGLGILLRQRGYLVIHASVLAREGEAFGFVGESGWGKSTLAEYFSRHGFDVLCDDVAAIDVMSGEITVIPGNGTVKLRSGAEAWFLGKSDRNNRRQLDGRIHLERACKLVRGVPLKKLYLLEKDFAPALHITDVDPTQRAVDLVRHTHAAHLLTRPDYQARLLAQCSRVAREIPISLLERPEGLHRLSQIREAVEKDIFRTVPAER